MERCNELRVESEKGGVESGKVGSSPCQSFVVLNGFHDWNVFEYSGEDELR